MSDTRFNISFAIIFITWIVVGVFIILTCKKEKNIKKITKDYKTCLKYQKEKICEQRYWKAIHKTYELDK